MKTKITLISAAIIAAVGGNAMALPNVANVTQKGSLVILPKIDVRGSTTTLVNVENDGDSLAYIKGYYVDTLKNKKDLLFPLTAHQKITFDVKTGITSAVGVGPHTVPSFPSTADSATATGVGELVLWVSDANGINHLTYNHITAKATEVDFSKQTAFQYQGWSFYSRNNVVAAQAAADGLLLLNGVAYDFAPQYLFSGFTPEGTTQNVAGGTVKTNSNTVYISSATQDLRQDYNWIVTKLDFDIWNGDEVKYTNAHRCSDSVFETKLGVVDDTTGTPGVLTPNPLVNGTNFLSTQLGTQAAIFRVQGNKSTQCDKYHIETPALGSTPATYTPSQSVGLVGVLVTEVEVKNGGVAAAQVAGAQTNVIGTALNVAGTRTGSITFDPANGGSVTPEKN